MRYSSGVSLFMSLFKCRIKDFFNQRGKLRNASKRYRGLINARRATRSNNFRQDHPGFHFGRTEQGLITEFMTSFGQINVSGDDMNIIQVGRPAVSRYHQIKQFSTQRGKALTSLCMTFQMLNTVLNSEVS